jgi:hypothetical protein
VREHPVDRAVGEAALPVLVQLAAQIVDELAGDPRRPAYLPERPSYRTAQNRGLSVTEIRYLSLRAHGEALVQVIVNRIS